MAQRSTKAEVQRRIDEVFRLRLNGAILQDIRDFAQENGWDVSDAQLGRYMQKADEMMAEELTRGRKKRLALHLARREFLYAKAVLAGDLRTALAVLKDNAQLCNLYPKPKVPSDDPQPALTDAERLAAIAALLEREGKKAA